MSEVNPDVQRAVQHLMQGVSDGKIVGVVYVGLTSDGQIVSAHALPVTPSFLYMGIGALHGIIDDLLGFVKKLREQQTSRILKPTTIINHG